MVVGVTLLTRESDTWEHLPNGDLRIISKGGYDGNTFDIGVAPLVYPDERTGKWLSYGRLLNFYAVGGRGPRIRGASAVALPIFSVSGLPI